jgi:hypothetical protein
MSDRKETTAKERRTRQPMGVMRRKLTLDTKTHEMLKSKGLVPRMVNDEDHGARIQTAIAGGYDFISSTGDMIVGDTTKKEDLNRRVRKLVGTHKDGSAKYAYLMAIHKDFYDEDQSKKEEQNQMVDDSIQGGSPKGLNAHGVAPDKGGTYKKNIQYSP